MRNTAIVIGSLWLVAIVALACGPSWPHAVDIHIASDGGVDQ